MSKREKVVRIGTVKVGEKPESVYCQIKFNDGKLSISGVVGPKRNGNCAGSAGQIIGSFLEFDSRGYYRISDISPAPGWDEEKISRFFSIWDKWHLNNMRPGCEHQRSDGWEKRPIDPSKPLESYGKFFPGQAYDSWNMLGWVTEKEHPEGLLSRPCPECGYKYGSAWLKEEVPQDVIDFLFSLPDTDNQPAWV